MKVIRDIVLILFIKSKEVIKMRKTFPNIIFFLIFMMLLSSSQVEASEKVDIQKLIQNAETAEDHINVAEFYENQAVKAESKAHMHASMAKTYERSPKRKAFAIHCKNLVQKYKEAAKEYGILAGEHRKIAEELKN